MVQGVPAVPVQAVAIDFQGADAFLQGFLEGAADGHGFATDFMEVVRTSSVPGIFQRSTGES